MLEPDFYTIVSKEIFSDIIVQRFFNVFCDGLQQYKMFREERYIQKIKKLSDTIKKYNFPNLGHIFKSDCQQKKSSSNTTKEIAQAQQIIDIARSRGMHMSEKLEYDLISKSSVFDNDYTSKPDKYVLVKKIEEKIVTEEVVIPTEDNNALIVDFMSLIHRIPVGTLTTFLDLFNAAWKHLCNVCNFNRTDIVYDSYVNNSLKECK